LKNQSKNISTESVISIPAGFKIFLC